MWKLFISQIKSSKYNSISKVIDLFVIDTQIKMILRLQLIFIFYIEQ